MPSPKNSRAEPPEVMTWMRAAPILAVGFVFDAVRFLFQQFWFFGPALAAAYCTASAGATVSKWTLGLLGTKTAGAACSAVVGTAGFFGEPVLMAFGFIMALAVGLMGWLTVGLLLIRTNGRIFKEHAGHSLWLLASLSISEIPIIGSIPALTITMVKIYRVQIKADKEALKKYEKENAAARSQERRQEVVALMRERTDQMNEMAANEARQAAPPNDGGIPQQLPQTAQTPSAGYILGACFFCSSSPLSVPRFSCLERPWRSLWGILRTARRLRFP